MTEQIFENDKGVRRVEGYYMNYKSKFIYALVIAVVSISSGYCATKEEIKMVAVTNKDAVIRAECVNISTGLTVGFRVEIINPNQNKYLVLVVRDDISRLFRVQLINEKGVDISPLRTPVPADKRGPNMPPAYRYETILPGSNYFWFIPVPTQVRADLSKFTNENNLMPLLDGKYMAEIVLSISYFMQDKGEPIQKLPKYPKIGEPIQKIPKYQSLMLTLPRIPIVVESKQLGQNIEDIYRGELSGSETNKQTRIDSR